MGAAASIPNDGTHGQGRMASRQSAESLGGRFSRISVNKEVLRNADAVLRRSTTRKSVEDEEILRVKRELRERYEGIIVSLKDELFKAQQKIETLAKELKRARKEHNPEANDAKKGHVSDAQLHDDEVDYWKWEARDASALRAFVAWNSRHMGKTLRIYMDQQKRPDIAYRLQSSSFPVVMESYPRLYFSCPPGFLVNERKQFWKEFYWKASRMAQSDGSSISLFDVNQTSPSLHPVPLCLRLEELERSNMAVFFLTDVSSEEEVPVTTSSHSAITSGLGPRLEMWRKRQLSLPPQLAEIRLLLLAKPWQYRENSIIVVFQRSGQDLSSDMQQLLAELREEGFASRIVEESAVSVLPRPGSPIEAGLGHSDAAHSPRQPAQRVHFAVEDGSAPFVAVAQRKIAPIVEETMAVLQAVLKERKGFAEDRGYSLDGEHSMLATAIECSLQKHTSLFAGRTSELSALDEKFEGGVPLVITTADGQGGEALLAKFLEIRRRHTEDMSDNLQVDIRATCCFLTGSFGEGTMTERACLLFLKRELEVLTGDWDPDSPWIDEMMAIGREENDDVDDASGAEDTSSSAVTVSIDFLRRTVRRLIETAAEISGSVTIAISNLHILYGQEMVADVSSIPRRSFLESSEQGIMPTDQVWKMATWWLFEKLPKNVNVIVTLTSGPLSHYLVRQGARSVVLDPLTLPERKGAAEKFCDNWRDVLGAWSSQIQNMENDEELDNRERHQWEDMNDSEKASIMTIVQARGAGSSLFLQTALRAIRTLDKVPLSARLLASSVHELLNVLLSIVESHSGPPQAQPLIICGLLACSRRGLSATELAFAAALTRNNASREDHDAINSEEINEASSEGSVFDEDWPPDLGMPVAFVQKTVETLRSLGVVKSFGGRLVLGHRCLYDLVLSRYCVVVKGGMAYFRRTVIKALKVLYCADGCSEDCGNDMINEDFFLSDRKETHPRFLTEGLYQMYKLGQWSDLREILSRLSVASFMLSSEGAKLGLDADLLHYWFETPTGRDSSLLPVYVEEIEAALRMPSPGDPKFRARLPQVNGDEKSGIAQRHRGRRGSVSELSAGLPKGITVETLRRDGAQKLLKAVDILGLLCVFFYRGGKLESALKAMEIGLSYLEVAPKAMGLAELPAREQVIKATFMMSCAKLRLRLKSRDTVLEAVDASKRRDSSDGTESSQWWQEPVALMKDGAAIVSRFLGDKSFQAGTACAQVASLLATIGHSSDAKDYYSVALRTLREYGEGVANKELAILLKNAGNFFLKESNFDKATSFFREAERLMLVATVEAANQRRMKLNSHRLEDLPLAQQSNCLYLRVMIVETTGVPSMDANGLCDPYFRIQWAEREKQTHIEYETVHPSHNAELCFCIPLDHFETDSHTSLRAWENAKDPLLHCVDYDEGSSDDLIAATTIPIGDALKMLMPGSVVQSRRCEKQIWLPMELSEEAIEVQEWNRDENDDSEEVLRVLLHVSLNLGPSLSSFPELIPGMDVDCVLLLRVDRAVLMPEGGAKALLDGIAKLSCSLRYKRYLKYSRPGKLDREFVTSDARLGGYGYERRKKRGSLVGAGISSEGVHVSFNETFSFDTRCTENEEVEIFLFEELEEDGDTESHRAADAPAGVDGDEEARCVGRAVLDLVGLFDQRMQQISLDIHPGMTLDDSKSQNDARHNKVIGRLLVTAQFVRMGFGINSELHVPRYSYTIIVHVIGCRELTGSKRNGLRNPSMRVRCGKKVVETRAEVSTLSPRFNEVFVFTVKHLMGGIHLACYEKGRSGAQARSERAADGSIRIKRRDTRFRSISSKSDKKVVPGSGKGEIGVGAFSLEDCSVEAGVQRKEIKLLQRMAGQQEVAGVVNLRLEVVPELEQSKLLQEERPMYIFLHVARCDGLAAMDQGGTSDPYVCIRFREEEEKTKIKRKTLNPTFNHYSTFKAMNLFDEIVLDVFDHDDIGENDFLGRCRILLEDTVIGEVLEKKVDLESRDGASKMKGTLSFRMQVLTEERIRERSVKAERLVLFLHVISADHLPQMDRSGLCDPFFEIRVGEKEARTRTKKKDRSPLFNQYFEFALESRFEELELSCMDHDVLSANDLIGQVSIPLARATLNETYEKELSLVNKDDKEKGTGTVRLRYQLVPLHIVTEEREKERRRLVKKRKAKARATNEVREESVIRVKSEDLILSLCISKGKSIPPMDRSGTSDPYVACIIGDKRLTTSIKKKTLSPSWHEFLTFKLDNRLDVLRLECYDHDKSSKDDLIGIVEIPLKNVELANATEFSEPLLDFDGNPCGGFLDFSIEIVSSEDVELLTVKEKEIELTVTVLSAINLIAMDRSGTSDPYLKLSTGDEEKLTSTKKKTLNPEWDETFVFQCRSFEQKLVMRCFDFDIVGRDDFMGEVMIELSSLRPGVSTEKVFPLQGLVKPNVYATGKLRCRLLILEKTASEERPDSASKPETIAPPSTELSSNEREGKEGSEPVVVKLANEKESEETIAESDEEKDIERRSIRVPESETRVVRKALFVRILKVEGVDTLSGQYTFWLAPKQMDIATSAASNNVDSAHDRKVGAMETHGTPFGGDGSDYELEEILRLPLDGAIDAHEGVRLELRAAPPGSGAAVFLASSVTRRKGMGNVWQTLIDVRKLEDGRPRRQWLPLAKEGTSLTDEKVDVLVVLRVGMNL